MNKSIRAQCSSFNTGSALRRAHDSRALAQAPMCTTAPSCHKIRHIIVAMICTPYVVLLLHPAPQGVSLSPSLQSPCWPDCNCKIGLPPAQRGPVRSVMCAACSPHSNSCTEKSLHHYICIILKISLYISIQLVLQHCNNVSTPLI